MTFIPSSMRDRWDAERTVSHLPAPTLATPTHTDRQLDSLCRNRLALLIAGKDTTDIDQAINERLAL